jgi:60 kDa SS-A/Ro ribonucleoprotein
VVTAHAGSSVAVWEALVPQLPPLALLRHLRALERHGVLEAHRERITRVFTDPSVVARSRILPFRFLEASRRVETAWLKDVLRTALDAAFVSVPDLPGRTVVALDRSGSMSAYMAQASVLALSLVRKARGRTRFMLFDDRLEDVALRADQGILAQAEALHARGGTNHALVVDRLLADREVVDNLAYVTDEQQNVGSPLLERLDTYRRRVNPRVKVFVVNVAPYAGGVAPPREPETWFAYGWSDATVAFVSMAARGFGSMVELVDRGAWDPQVQ